MFRLPAMLLTTFLLLSGFSARADAQIPLPTESEGVANRPAAGAVGELGRGDTVAVSSAPQVRELMCRGGPSGLDLAVTGQPSPRNPAYVEMRLDYRRDETDTGSGWLVLEPGTCSWNPGLLDAAVPIEPGYVLFDTQADAQHDLRQQQMLHGAAEPVDVSSAAAERYADTLSIPRYLQDSGHFWVFYVMDAGEQVAISHGPWKPSLTDQLAGGGLEDPSSLPTTREAPTPLGTRPVDDGLPDSREAPDPLGTTRLGDSLAPPPTTPDLPTLKLRGVSVGPTLEGVTVRFRTAPNAAPVVQFSKTKPIREPIAGLREPNMTGRWMFESGAFAAHVHELTQRKGSYFAVPMSPLERNTSYHFIIDVPAYGPSPAQQHIGEFRTWSQRVTVTFTEIRMVSPAETDLELTFVAGDLLRTLCQDDGNTCRWNAGSRNRIQVELGSGDDAPDLLPIHVSVRNIIEKPSNFDRLGSDACTTSYAPVGGNRFLEWNCARAEFDLRRFPGQRAGTSFTLRSLPLRNGSSLMFDVSGTIEITRN